ncbi:MAG: hypothetical protein M3P33_03715, partial [bacterium]|nr:hypothetical protein [bacterium]
WRIFFFAFVLSPRFLCSEIILFSLRNFSHYTGYQSVEAFPSVNVAIEVTQRRLDNQNSTQVFEGVFGTLTGLGGILGLILSHAPHISEGAIGVGLQYGWMSTEERDLKI